MSFPIACVIASLSFVGLMLFHWRAAQAALPEMTEEERREWDESDESDLSLSGVYPNKDGGYSSPQHDHLIETPTPSLEISSVAKSTSAAVAVSSPRIVRNQPIGAWLREVGAQRQWTPEMIAALERCTQSVSYFQLEHAYIVASAWETLGIRHDIAEALSDEAFLLSASSSKQPAWSVRKPKKPKYATVCVESKSARSVLKFKLVHRFFRYIVYRSLLVNFTLTLFVSIVVACMDAWWDTPYCPSNVYSCVVPQYVIDWAAVVYSVGSLLVSAVLIIFFPTLAFRCGCVGSPLQAVVTLAATFLSIMEQTSMQSLMYKISFNMQQEISECTMFYHVPSDKLKTTLDWRLYGTFGFAAAKLLLSIWTFALVQRLAFMPLLEPQVSPKAVARLLFDYYNVRGMPYGLIPTHRCIPVKLNDKDAPEDDLNTPMLSVSRSDVNAPIVSSAAYASLAAVSPMSPIVLHNVDHSHTQFTCSETPILRTYDVDLPPGESPLKPHFIWNLTTRCCCCRRRMGGWIFLVAVQCAITIIQAVNVLMLAARLSDIYANPDNCKGPAPPPTP